MAWQNPWNTTAKLAGYADSGRRSGASRFARQVNLRGEYSMPLKQGGKSIGSESSFP
jgi:hypothetical protein